MHLPQLRNHSSCKLCPLHEAATNTGIGGIWLEDSLEPSTEVPALVFIGQNPGYEEDRAAVPFIGRSGIMLRGGWIKGAKPVPEGTPGAEKVAGAYVDAFDLRSRASVYVTNTVRCYTMDNAKPGWKDHVKPCFPYLAEDIVSICRVHAPSPVCLVCCGETASLAVLRLGLGHARMSQSDAFKKHNAGTALVRFEVKDDQWSMTQAAAGASREQGAFNVTLFHAYHPAYVLRNPNASHAVERQLSLLDGFLGGTLAAVSKPDIVAVRPPRTGATPCPPPAPRPQPRLPSRPSPSATTGSSPASSPAPPRRPRSAIVTKKSTGSILPAHVRPSPPSSSSSGWRPRASSPATGKNHATYAPTRAIKRSSPLRG